ncbi:MAG: dUTP diphosphatase [Clostridia bacterium]|nr:dUTP diphosphatase [Clostridia bacterium]MBQ6468118.1 dUTP diphosphatase [Clostridia bacterium]MBR6334696.1 dUTP diphosphatase [Clostridia bacterium]
MDTLKIKKLKENARIPARATSGSAGMDLYACIDEPVTVNPGEKAVIPTGIAIALPSPELGAFIFARSGLAIKHGIGLLNAVGVIDSDYRGEICVGLINQLSEPYTIAPDERIAQMIIMPVSLIPVEEAEELDETERGAGGFGSTGKR